MPGGLSLFTAIRDTNRQVRFDWKTIREPNLAYFSIESSNNKVNFTKTADVKTAGRGTNHAYTFSYADSASSRMYYRLRLVGTDSSTALSSTVFVDPSKRDSIINGIGTNTIGIILYPNPAQNSITIEHPAREQGAISIHDFAGRVLKTARILPRTQQTVLSLRNLPAGKYILLWTSEQEKKTVSFIKGGQ